MITYSLFCLLGLSFLVNARPNIDGNYGKIDTNCQCSQKTVSVNKLIFPSNQQNSTKMQADLKPVALYPLNAKYQGADATGNNPNGSFHKVLVVDPPSVRVFLTNKISRFTQRNGLSYIQIPNNLNSRFSNIASLTVLIHIRSNKDSGLILANGKDSMWGFKKEGDNSIIQYIKYKNTIMSSTKMPFDKNDNDRWHSIGYSYDHNTCAIKFWYDQKEYNIASAGTPGIHKLFHRKPIFLGAKLASRPKFYGDMFCLQVYNRALTKQEIGKVINACVSYN